MLTPDYRDYVVAHGSQLDEIARDLVAETRATSPREAGMLIEPEQAAFMTLLTKIIGVRRAVEIGTFTGFSALCIARGLPPDGSLLCLDRNQEWTAVARRYWARAGVDDRIELRLGDALPTLRSLPSAETFALAFVDADKTGYQDYVEELYGRMTPNGVVLLDNTLRQGRALAPTTDDDHAVVALNAALAVDPRWETVLLPVADGLTVLRKR